MTPTFEFTPEATSDVLNIWSYVAQAESAATADRVVDRIYDECREAGAMPGIGHFRTDLVGREYRFRNAWKYLIVYRWQPQPIQVVAVVHGARDLGPFFADRLP